MLVRNCLLLNREYVLVNGLKALALIISMCYARKRERELYYD
jgi:hypothetical protein